MNPTYDLLLVARSIAVAIIAAYTALELSGRVGRREGWTSWAWLTGGAALMGGGVWSMHFIGMLAIRPPFEIGFDAAGAAVSMAIAVAASGIALFLVRRHPPTSSGIALGAILIGSGISAMHYTAMGSMRMSPAIEYDAALAAASVFVAIVGAFAALWLALRVRQRGFGGAILAKVGSAVVLGSAIGSMHYLAMASARFPPAGISLAIGSAGGMDRDAMALAVGFATLCIVAVTLGLAARDAYQAAHGVRLARSLRTTNEQLRDLALHDTLTGLPNRMLLDDRMAQAATRSRRSGKSFAFMFLDLDRFKPVNDSLGHATGDELLVAVAKRLVACVRRPDTVARTGGDEFAIVLSEIEDPRDAGLVGGKILDELSRPFFLGPQEVSISGSIGISVYPADGRDVDTLMANADMAMYRAKRDGRNGYRFFVPGMLAKAAR
jgi:diguanylate cyclase (GGDEF)-like protein